MRFLNGISSRERENMTRTSLSKLAGNDFTQLWLALLVARLLLVVVSVLLLPRQISCAHLSLHLSCLHSLLIWVCLIHFVCASFQDNPSFGLYLRIDNSNSYPVCYKLNSKNPHIRTLLEEEPAAPFLQYSFLYVRALSPWFFIGSYFE